MHVTNPEKRAAMLEGFKIKNNNGDTPLMQAALDNKVDSVRFLIGLGLSCDIQDLERLKNKGLQNTESFRLLGESLNLENHPEDDLKEIQKNVSSQASSSQVRSRTEESLLYSWTEIFKALEKDPFAQIATSCFKDRELALSVLSRYPEHIRCIRQDYVTPIMASFALCQNGLVLEYMPEKFKEDKELLSIAIKENFDAYKFIPQKYKSDKELALIALAKNAQIFQKLPVLLREDESFVLDAIEINDAVVKYTPLASNLGFMIKATQRNVDAKLHAPSFNEKLKNIKQIEKQTSSHSWTIDESLFLEKNKEGEAFIGLLQKGEYPFKELKQYVLKKKASVDFYFDQEILSFEELEATIQAISFPYILSFWEDVDAIPSEMCATLFKNGSILKQLYLSRQLLSSLSVDSINKISSKLPNISTLFIEGSYVEILPGFSKETFPSLKKVVTLYTGWIPYGVAEWLKDRKDIEFTFTLNKPSSSSYTEELLER